MIIFDDFTTANKWVDFRFKIKSSAMKILTSKDNNKYDIRYLYHVIQTIRYVPVDHSRQWIGTYSKFTIPVPHPDVQCEIVRILDNFTELTAELTARKKQYEYYRDKFITKIAYNTVKLSEVTDIYLGLTYTPTYVENGVKFISAQNTSKDYLDLTNVKYISREEFEKSTSNAKPKRGDILFTRVGSNLGHPVIVDTDEDLCMFVSLGYLRVNSDRLLNRYLRHWMNTDLFWSQVRKNVHLI